MAVYIILNDLDELEVRLEENPEATYFTNDYEDAVLTAKDMAERANVEIDLTTERQVKIEFEPSSEEVIVSEIDYAKAEQKIAAEYRH